MENEKLEALKPCIYCFAPLAIGGFSKRYTRCSNWDCGALGRMYPTEKESIKEHNDRYNRLYKTVQKDTEVNIGGGYICTIGSSETDDGL